MTTVYCDAESETIECVWLGVRDAKSYPRANLPLPNADKADWEQFLAFDDEDFPVANVKTGKMLTVGEVRGRAVAPTSEDICNFVESHGGQICAVTVMLAHLLHESEVRCYFAEFSLFLHNNVGLRAMFLYEQRIKALQERIVELKKLVARKLQPFNLTNSLLRLLGKKKQELKKTEEEVKEAENTALCLEETIDKLEEKNIRLEEDLRLANKELAGEKVDSKRWRVLYEFIGTNPSETEKQEMFAQLRDEWGDEFRMYRHDPDPHAPFIPLGPGSAFDFLVQYLHPESEDEESKDDDASDDVVDNSPTAVVDPPVVQVVAVPPPDIEFDSEIDEDEACIPKPSLRPSKKLRKE